MAKKVSYAILHDGLFIPGIGNLKNTLPPDNKTLKDFQMTLQGGDSPYGSGSLLLEWTGAGNKKMAYVVGSATVKGAFVDTSKVEE